MDLRQHLSDPSLLQTQCSIAGAWCGGADDPVANPADQSLLASVPRFGKVEAEAAVEAAAQAFAGWAARTCKQRSGLLDGWFELMKEARDDLATILTAEQGKPLAEAKAEIDYAASYIEFYAEEAKRVQGEILASPWQDARMLVLRQPAGVVAAITPWNFPAAMITRKIAPALAAGCTVVLKPAPETPLTALSLALLAERAGLPPGVLNVLTGEAAAIGEVFTTHRAVRVLAFTGSTRTGKLLAAQCVPTLKRVLLELGGNAPFLVFEDADLAEAVEGAMQAKFRNSGQTCVCANRFYVQAGVHDEFLERMQSKVKQLRLGSGFDPASTQGPLINQAAVTKVKAHIADAQAKGARLICGGGPSKLGGTFFEPTLLSHVSSDMLLNTEETFGPVAPVTKFVSEEEGIEQANATDTGLAAYLYTRDLGRTIRVAEALQCGMVGVNSGLISSELAPFGGIRESGNSREGSHHGIAEFLEMKYVRLGGLAPSGAAS